jgi:hypothetical protein
MEAPESNLVIKEIIEAVYAGMKRDDDEVERIDKHAQWFFGRT